MRGDILNKSDFIEHNDLRNESQRLEPQGVTPSKLPCREPCIDDHSQSEGCWKQDLNVGEVITKLVIGLWIKIKTRFGNTNKLNDYVRLTVQQGFLYLIRYIMNAVDEMKNIFIDVLQTEMKYMKRSRYLTQNTIKYSS